MTAIEPTAVTHPPRAITVFGREPAAWVGLIEVVIALALSFAAFITGEQAALVMAVLYALSGFYVGWATKDVNLARIIGLIKAAVALLAGFGFVLNDAQQGSIMAAASVIFTVIINRDRTSPVADPIDPSPQQVTSVPATDEVAGALVASDVLEQPSQDYPQTYGSKSEATGYDARHDRP